jgi:hypothetical protein
MVFRKLPLQSLLHRDAFPHRTPKVNAYRKVDIEHHTEVRSSKHSCDVSPRVELTVEGVYNNVHVDIEEDGENNACRSD